MFVDKDSNRIAYMISNVPESPILTMTATRKRKVSSLAFASGPCHSCTKLNLQCDRVRPRCGTCLSRNTLCAGFVQELKWGNGIASRGYNSKRSIPISRSIRKKKDNAEPVRARDIKLLIPTIAPNTPLIPLIGLLPAETKKWIHHFHHVGAMSLFCVEGIESNLYRQVLRVALQQSESTNSFDSSCLMNAIHAFASWQLGFSESRRSGQPSALTLRSTEKALKGLQQHINTSMSLSDDLFEFLLCTIVMLIDCEQLQKACGFWNVHLSRAKTVLELYPHNLKFASSNARGSIVWIIWCDLNLALLQRVEPIIPRYFLESLLENPSGVGWDIFQLTSTSSMIMLTMHDFATHMASSDLNGIRKVIIPRLVVMKEEFLNIEAEGRATEESTASLIRVDMLLLKSLVYLYEEEEVCRILATSIISRAASLQGRPCQKLMSMPILEASKYLNQDCEKEWVKCYYQYWSNEISCLLYIDCLNLAEASWSYKGELQFLFYKNDKPGQYLFG